MLHREATTQLQVCNSGLTMPIKVTFYFRQGDSLSMHLYCIQRKPLLRRVMTVLSELRIGSNQVVSYREVDEVFCDDENVISSDLEDVTRFDEVMKQYEGQSGAMLSRSTKCKILYLGSWRDRKEAPFPWLKVVKKLTVFGIILTPDYESTLKRTWEETFRGCQKTIFLWKQRTFDTMRQRVEVSQTFALSKLWYICQILPLPPTIAKKIEAPLSSFLFQGKLERLKLVKLFLPQQRGGLGLQEVRSTSATGWHHRSSTTFQQ